MTKKHFIELANVIRYNQDAFSKDARKLLAEFCKQQNANFNADRWNDYIDGKCGSSGGKTKAAAR